MKYLYFVLNAIQLRAKEKFQEKQIEARLFAIFKPIGLDPINKSHKICVSNRGFKFGSQNKNNKIATSTSYNCSRFYIQTFCLPIPTRSLNEHFLYKSHGNMSVIIQFIVSSVQ